MKDSNVCTCFFRSSVIGSIFLKPVLVWFSICVIIGACLLVFGVSDGIFLESVLVWMSFRGAEVVRRHDNVPSHNVSIFLGQEVYHSMVYNTYHTKLNLQICNYTQKRRICRENSKNAPAKIFVGIFAFPERLSNSAPWWMIVFS